MAWNTESRRRSPMLPPETESEGASCTAPSRRLTLVRKLTAFASERRKRHLHLHTSTAPSPDGPAAPAGKQPAATHRSTGKNEAGSSNRRSPPAGASPDATQRPVVLRVSTAAADSAVNNLPPTVVTLGAMPGQEAPQSGAASLAPLAVEVEVLFSASSLVFLAGSSIYHQWYAASQSLVPSNRLYNGLLRRIDHCSKELITRKDSGALQQPQQQRPAQYTLQFRLLRRDSSLVAQRTFCSYQRGDLTSDDAREIILATHRMVGLFLRRHDPGFRWSNLPLSPEFAHLFSGPEDGSPDRVLRPWSAGGTPSALSCIPPARFLDVSQSDEFVPGFSIRFSFRSRCPGRRKQVDFLRVVCLHSKQSAPLSLILAEDLLFRSFDAVNTPLSGRRAALMDEHSACGSLEGLVHCQHNGQDDALDVELRIENNLGPQHSHLRRSIHSKLGVFRDPDAEDCQEFFRNVHAALVHERDAADRQIDSLPDFDLRILALRGPTWSVDEPARFVLGPELSYSRRTIDALLSRIHTGIADVLRGQDQTIDLVAYKRGHCVLRKTLVAHAHPANGSPQTSVSSSSSSSDSVVALLNERIQHDIDTIFKDTCTLDGIAEDAPIDVQASSAIAVPSDSADQTLTAVVGPSPLMKPMNSVVHEDEDIPVAEATKPAAGAPRDVASPDAAPAGSQPASPTVVELPDGFVFDGVVPCPEGFSSGAVRAPRRAFPLVPDKFTLPPLMDTIVPATSIAKADHQLCQAQSDTRSGEAEGEGPAGDGNMARQRGQVVEVQHVAASSLEPVVEEASVARATDARPRTEESSIRISVPETCDKAAEDETGSLPDATADTTLATSYDSRPCTPSLSGADTSPRSSLVETPNLLASGTPATTPPMRSPKVDAERDVDLGYAHDANSESGAGTGMVAGTRETEADPEQETGAVMATLSVPEHAGCETCAIEEEKPLAVASPLEDVVLVAQGETGAVPDKSVNGSHGGFDHGTENHTMIVGSLEDGVDSGTPDEMGLSQSTEFEDEFARTKPDLDFEDDTGGASSRDRITDCLVIPGRVEDAYFDEDESDGSDETECYDKESDAVPAAPEASASQRSVASSAHLLMRTRSTQETVHFDNSSPSQVPEPLHDEGEHGDQEMQDGRDLGTAQNESSLCDPSLITDDMDGPAAVASIDGDDGATLDDKLAPHLLNSPMEGELPGYGDRSTGTAESRSSEDMRDARISSSSLAKVVSTSSSWEDCDGDAVSGDSSSRRSGVVRDSVDSLAVRHEQEEEKDSSAGASHVEHESWSMATAGYLGLHETKLVEVGLRGALTGSHAFDNVSPHLPGKGPPSSHRLWPTAAMPTPPRTPTQQVQKLLQRQAGPSTPLASAARSARDELPQTPVSAPGSAAGSCRPTTATLSRPSSSSGSKLHRRVRSASHKAAMMLPKMPKRNRTPTSPTKACLSAQPATASPTKSSMAAPSSALERLGPAPTTEAELSLRPGSADDGVLPRVVMMFAGMAVVSQMINKSS